MITSMSTSFSHLPDELVTDSDPCSSHNAMYGSESRTLIASRVRGVSELPSVLGSARGSGKPITSTNYTNMRKNNN